MVVIILGCGPAGLFAAHAARLAGHSFVIYSDRKRPSHLNGAQYLHEAIPGLSEGTGFTVHYRLNGDPEEYAKKVYGDVPPDFVSPENLIGDHQAWDIRAAYNRAWNLYERYIDPVGIIKPADLLRELEPGGALYRMRIISTIPAPSICRRPAEHVFASRSAWAIGDAPGLGIVSPFSADAADTVVCDGTRDVGWYRVSTIRGCSTAEWPEEHRPPIDDVARITKVVRTTCDCWRDLGFWRTGRYGAWDKKLLTHHAYWNILEAFQAEEGAEVPW